MRRRLVEILCCALVGALLVGCDDEKGDSDDNGIIDGDGDSDGHGNGDGDGDGALTLAERAVAVVESLESGDPTAIENYISEDNYIQHNLAFHDGSQTHPRCDGRRASRGDYSGHRSNIY